MIFFLFILFFFFKQKTAYEMLRSLVGSEMCIRDRCHPPRTDLPKMWLDPGEAGIRYDPVTDHDKVSRFGQHEACDASWVAADPRVHGLANDERNRVYPKEDNFMHQEQLVVEGEPSKETGLFQLQLRFRGNSVRGNVSGGHRVVLQSEPAETVLSLKERLQDQMLDRDSDRNYHPGSILFFWRDQLLEDARTVGEYGIGKWETVNVQMRAGFGTAEGELFSTVAEYKWDAHTGFERDKRGDPVLMDGYGMDHDSRYLEGYDSDLE
eukprot:TRINITY_DN27209_c0_g1_i2.p2 TRINITY_DN27209_c0_g1~~TRINITY_DN27209_c0_g1_i2.p2  ORF type:complete len:266 (-),score=71.23 TRINITY_DN27209_c0_g1_i2:272-1069(-)